MHHDSGKVPDEPAWGKIVAGVVLGFAAVAHLSRLGATPIGDGDEARYALIVHELIGRQAWWDLTLQGAPYLNKPPLHFDLMKLSALLLGESEVALRLPTALFGLGMVFLIYFFLRKHFGWRVAVLGALIQSTNNFVLLVRGSRAAVLDAPLCFYLFAALICLACRRPSDRRVLLAGTILGLAGLTKGLFMLIVPLVWGAWQTFDPLGRPTLKQKMLLLLTPAAALTLSWPLYMAAHHGASFLRHYFLQQQIDRIALEVSIPYHFALYLVLFAFWIPWNGFAAWGCVRVLRDHAVEKRRLLLLLVCWAGTGLIAMTLFVSKAPRYFYPFFPAFACLAAWGVDDLFKRVQTTKQRLAVGLLPTLVTASCIASVATVLSNEPRETMDTLFHFSQQEKIPVFLGSTAAGRRLDAESATYYLQRLRDVGLPIGKVDLQDLEHGIVLQPNPSEFDALLQNPAPLTIVAPAPDIEVVVIGNIPPPALPGIHLQPALATADALLEPRLQVDGVFYQVQIQWAVPGCAGTTLRIEQPTLPHATPFILKRQRPARCAMLETLIPERALWRSDVVTLEDESLRRKSVRLTLSTGENEASLEWDVPTGYLSVFDPLVLVNFSPARKFVSRWD